MTYKSGFIDKTVAMNAVSANEKTWNGYNWKQNMKGKLRV